MVNLGPESGASGREAGFDAASTLLSSTGSNGFVPKALGEGDGSGYSVSIAGDVNGDGF